MTETVTTTNLPPVPSVSLVRLFNLRDKLSAAATGFLGHTLDPDTFQCFVDKLHAKLPKPVLRQIVADSMISLRGQKLTPTLLVNTCWRFAGNIEKLQNCEAVPAWFIQRTREWVMCSIEHVRMQRKHGKLGHSLVFQVLTGEAASMQVSQWWSNKKIYFLALYRDEHGKGFGFSRYSEVHGYMESAYPFDDPRQLYGLRCFMLAEPQKDKKELVLSVVEHSATTEAFNRELMRKRQRTTPEYRCPFGLPAEQKCYLCVAGTDKCPAACHSKTYVMGVCKRCKNERAYFDKEDTGHAGHCVNCVYLQRKG